MTRTKIVATVGPACGDPTTLGAIIEAGVDVLRINFSHGTFDDHGEALQRIRDHCDRTGAIVAVLGDLCGPKIRVGALDGGTAVVEAGKPVVIQRQSCLGNAERFSVNYDRLVDEVEVGARVLLDDGKIALRVTEKHSDELVCTCAVGGALRDHVGVNLPDSELSVPALTENDHTSLAWAIESELDYVALSFVRRPEDIHELRQALAERGSHMRIVAKIEKPEAVLHLDEIIEATDALLVARGDLGVEMDVARVPLLQKDMTMRCRRAGKPVIIATQMLQSMTDSATPTRAEVSDVANAILDSTDAVMLSAETAIGKYPVEAVRVMTRIADETEAFATRTEGPLQDVAAASARVASAVAEGAALLATKLAAKLVVVWTQGGELPRLLSKHRFGPPIIGLTPDPHVCRRMALHYGVFPVRMDHPGGEFEMLQQLDGYLLGAGLAAPGDLTVVVAGANYRGAGAANALLIHFVADSNALPNG